MTPIIIVPYRDREEHLKVFVPALNEYLPEAKIFVIEQDDDRPFNRGKLINAGFLVCESQDDYFIMHDVDMIPVKGLVDYSYPEAPMHIATQASQFNYILPYDTYFGGVNIFTGEQFRSINGFVNTMIGYGAEDDSVYQSFMINNISICRRLCRFESLPHERHIDPILHRRNVQKLNRPRDFNDGLTSCIFTITSREEKEGYTHIKVKI